MALVYQAVGKQILSSGPNGFYYVDKNNNSKFSPWYADPDLPPTRIWNEKNILFKVDSYKPSHAQCYPPGAEAMESYIEARAGQHLTFGGLQVYIQDYLLTPITQDNVDEAADFYAIHGEPFDKEMWQYIVDTYNGYIPVKIEAVPEGSIIPNRNIVAKISCNDPKCFSAASFLETGFLRAVWYTSTVATYSYDCKQVIKKYLELTSDNVAQILYKLHSFAGRGLLVGVT